VTFFSETREKRELEVDSLSSFTVEKEKAKVTFVSSTDPVLTDVEA
jgi:hypothetical protein